MKTRRISAWMLLALVFFPGCAKLRETFGRLHSGSTRVRVSSSGRRGAGISPLAPILGGGMMVYAVRSDGAKEAMFVPDETAPASMILSNGVYGFTAVGWDSTNLGGSPRCGASAQQLSLTGADTDVTIDMSPANCAAAGAYAPAIAIGGGSFIPLKIVFCAEGTDVSPLTSASNCPTGSESAMFAKGNTSASMTDGDYFSSLGTMVYMANPVNSNYQVYASTLGGANIDVRRLSPPPPAGSTGVQQLRRVYGTNKGLFIMNEGVSAGNALYLFDLGSGAVTKISHAAPAGGSNGVQEIRVAEDGSFVVFVSDAASAGVYDLWSVPLTGATFPAPTKISGTVTGGATGIYHCGSCTGDHTWGFEIAPDTTDPYLVYASYQGSTTQSDLFIASLNGSALAATSSINGVGGGSVPSGTQISGSEIVTGDYVDSIQFTADSAHVVYHGHQTSSDRIYSIDVSLSLGTSLTTSPPNTVAAADAYPPYFTANTTADLVYSTFNGTTLTIHSVDLASPGTTNFALQDMAATEQGLSQGQFLANDTGIILATNNGAYNNPIHVFYLSNSATADYAGVTYRNYSGVLASPRKIYQYADGHQGSTFQIDDSGTYLAYAADANTASNVELFYATIASAGATAISGTIASASESVAGFAIQPDLSVYFAAAHDNPPHPELYSTTLSATPTVTRLNSGSAIGDILKVSRGETSSTLFLKARTTANTAAQEGWVYDTALDDYTEVSPLPDGSASGLGRVKMSLVSYNLGGGGPIAEVSSTCLAYDSGSPDGGAIFDPSNPVKVPIGPGAGYDAPFAVAVDVFPLASSCNGPSFRYYFPHGIANGNQYFTSTNLDGDSSTALRLFIEE